jgi:hypothetical protein
LYQILEASHLKGNHANALLVFGHVGDEADARKLEQFMLRKYAAPRTRFEETGAYAILCALGIMSRRGIPDAVDILDRMTEFDYWNQAQSAITADPRSGAPWLSEVDILIDVVYAQAISGQASSARRKVLAQLAGAGLPKSGRGDLDLERLEAYARGVEKRMVRVPTPKERRELEDACVDILECLQAGQSVKTRKLGVCSEQGVTLPLAIRDE